MLAGNDGTSPFEVVDGWEQLPADLKHLDVADVAVDSDDRVYVLTRLVPRVLVYDTSGSLIRSWGPGVLSDRPHGLTLAPDGSLYVVDEADHVVRRLSAEGELLQVIGSGVPSQTGHDQSVAALHDRLATIRQSAGPFNRPTKLAVGPNDDLYVTDGYGNSRIHRFRPDGQLVQSFGTPGSGPGMFYVPHSVLATDEGQLLVADRENDRIQVFDLDGAFVAEWTDVQRPTALSRASDGSVFVAELAWFPGERSWVHGPIEAVKPARLSKYDPHGNLLGRWTESDDGSGAGSLFAPHGLAVDSAGSIYVGEVSHSFGSKRTDATKPFNTLQKFALTS